MRNLIIEGKKNQNELGFDKSATDLDSIISNYYIIKAFLK